MSHIFVSGDLIASTAVEVRFFKKNFPFVLYRVHDLHYFIYLSIWVFVFKWYVVRQVDFTFAAVETFLYLQLLVRNLLITNPHTNAIITMWITASINEVRLCNSQYLHQKLETFYCVWLGTMPAPNKLRGTHFLYHFSK